jgi:hypothetical protein
MTEPKPSSGYLKLVALMDEGGLGSAFLSRWTCPCCDRRLIIGFSVLWVKRNSDGVVFWRIGVAAASAASAVKRGPCTTRDELNRLLDEDYSVGSLKAFWKQVGSFITTDEKLEKDAAYTVQPRMTIEQFRDYLREHHSVYGALFEDTIERTLLPFRQKETELLTGMRSD